MYQFKHTLTYIPLWKVLPLIMSKSTFLFPDSWVELHYDSSSEHSEGTPTPSDITDLEKMLLEAQRESSSSSRTSSHCSRCVETLHFYVRSCVVMRCNKTVICFFRSPRRVQTPPLISLASFNAHISVQVKYCVINLPSIKNTVPQNYRGKDLVVWPCLLTWFCLF